MWNMSLPLDFSPERDYCKWGSSLESSQGSMLGSGKEKTLTLGFWLTECISLKWDGKKRRGRGSHCSDSPIPGGCARPGGHAHGQESGVDRARTSPWAVLPRLLAGLRAAAIRLGVTAQGWEHWKGRAKRCAQVEREHGIRHSDDHEGRQTARN